MDEEQNSGNGRCEPQECLQTLCDDAFEGDVAKTALALGREQAEIRDMLSGDMTVDADLDMKVHGEAQQRGVEL